MEIVLKTRGLTISLIIYFIVTLLFVQGVFRWKWASVGGERVDIVFFRFKKNVIIVGGSPSPERLKPFSLSRT